MVLLGKDVSASLRLIKLTKKIVGGLLCITELYQSDWEVELYHSASMVRKYEGPQF